METLNDSNIQSKRNKWHQYQATFDCYLGNNGSMAKEPNTKNNDTPSKYDKIKQKRAEIILSKENAIRKITKGMYLVQSQSGHGRYKVHWNGKNWVCDCPDYIKNGQLGPCKHIIALKLHFVGFVSIEGQEPTVKKKTYPQNWSLYNKAQMQEFELFDKLLYHLVEPILGPEYKGPGRPPLKTSTQIFCCVMKVYSMLSSRRAKWLYQEAVQRQQIERSPHFNVASTTLNNKEITPILHNLVRLSAQPLSSIEHDFAVDSSGFRCSSFGKYCEEKHGTKRMRKWLKVHICTGVKTNIISDVIITDEHAGDSPQFATLLKNTAGHFQINEVSADPAYSSRDNHDIVNKLGGKPFILFKKNATGTSKGSKLWSRTYHYFQLHKEDFLEHYHKRSNVESTFAAIKKKFGETLKSRNHTAQVNEMLCKIIAYNITVLIREMIKMGADPELISIDSLRKEVSTVDGEVKK